MDALKVIAQDSLKTGDEIPQIKIGDTVKVSVKIREGSSSPLSASCESAAGYSNLNQYSSTLRIALQTPFKVKKGVTNKCYTLIRTII